MRLSRTFIIVALAATLAAPSAATGADTAQATAEAKPAEAEPATSPLATQGPMPAKITPPKREAIDAAIQRGVKFLLDDQRPDGSWGSAEKTKGLNIYAPPPGAHDAFHAAVTSLVVMALIDAEPHLPDDQRKSVNKAIDRGAEWLNEHLGELRRASADALYNIWGHAYSIRALVALHDRAQGDAERQAELKKLAEQQADFLERYSFVGGGWSYYDFLAGTQTPGDAAFSFITATVLIALDDAKSIGIEFSERLTNKAVASIQRQRRPNFSYVYGEYLMRVPTFRANQINRPGGSLGRSQVCNLALRLYGDKRVTDEVIETWLNRLFARNGWLSIGRKRPVPHEAWFQIAGYFYYFGHYYAAMCIDELPAEERPYFQDHLARILLPLQEADGCWWDYPLYDYHQSWGTAMAVSALVRCRHE